jgi:hypothetical protein
MAADRDLRSLKYLVTALEQFSVMLRDFHLDETAKLLDAARTDLEAKLPAEAERKKVDAEGMSAPTEALS